MNRTFPRLVMDEIMLTRLLVALIRTTGVFLGGLGIVLAVLDADFVAPVDHGFFLLDPSLALGKDRLSRCATVLWTGS